MADGSTPVAAEAPSPPVWREGDGRRSVPDAVWAAARDDYLAGLSAPEVCRRHGVGLTALRMRAARDGWRRADQPWIPPNRLDPWDEGRELEERLEGDLDKVEPRDLWWIADRRMMRAVLRGDAVAAMRWCRVRDLLDAEATELERQLAQEEVLENLARAHVEAAALEAEIVAKAEARHEAQANAVNAVNAVNGVFAGQSPPPAGPDAPPPP